MLIRTYLPQDRLRAIANGGGLPKRTTGSALFADISGFTTLTEALSKSLGSRRGSEELTKQLNAVYNALIAEVERFGGSVIDFAGDAITCWFDDSNGSAAPRATACSVALQRAMQTFAKIDLPDGAAASLTIKVAVATGSARRFVVGDPSIRYLDALSGATIARTSTAEHLAKRGDILLDEATVNRLGANLVIAEWRIDPEGGERFAVIKEFIGRAEEISFPDAPMHNLKEETLQAWVLQPVYEREQEFLTEFRPCIAVFVRFIGIDFDADEAEEQLNAFICTAQRIVERHEGVLLEITIGDKGSYTYLNFGALSAHEDDARRAVRTAVELRDSIRASEFPLQLQIGITQGIMRVGAYGGQTRRTYGALGDDVNLAARLMQASAPGEIMVSKRIQKATAALFDYEPRPELILKGKTGTITAFVVSGEHRQRSIRLQEPSYALPMIGRKPELETINALLDRAQQSSAQTIGIVAEAGMGKSRLVAEVIRSARRKGFAGYGGACQSDGTTTPYLVWRSIWNAFFNVDSDLPLHDQIRLLSDEVERLAPDRLQALPLLGQVLNINIPDNEFTRGLEPKSRKSALHALLEDCLIAMSRNEPLLLVIEDLHWIDVLSYDLLVELARDLPDSRICFVLAYRPAQLARIDDRDVRDLPNLTKIKLDELNKEECAQAILAKLAQLYPAHDGAVPPILVERLIARSQGNPFYLEELLNYLHDREIDLHDPSALTKIDLPDSIHALILSRIDKLTEQKKTTLRVASIIGRLFRVAWLTGYYPALGDDPQVTSDLEELNQLDITPMDSPEPELVYLFKHIVTHEVAYETLAFSTRAQLHEQLAFYLESTYRDSPPLNELAFHYGRSDNQIKQREYLLKAAEAARASFANDAALGYYQQLIDRLSDQAERIDILLKRGNVLEITGEWQDAHEDYSRALNLAEQKNDREAVAACKHKIGSLCYLRGDSEAALAWLIAAREILETLGNESKLAAVLLSVGTIYQQKGEPALSRQYLNAGLDLARKLGDQQIVSECLNTLGMGSVEQGDYAAARTSFEESLQICRAIGRKEGIAMTTNNLGLVALQQEDFKSAQAQFEESLRLAREMGNKRGIAINLTNLGYTAANQTDFGSAQKYYEESLSIYRKMGNKLGIIITLENLGFAEIEQDENIEAQEHYAESLRLARETDSKFHVVYSLVGLGNAGVYAGAALDQLCLSAQLLAAADALLKSMNMALERLEQDQFNRIRDEMRTALGDDRFNAAWLEGQSLTMNAAIDLALDQTLR